MVRFPARVKRFFSSLKLDPEPTQPPMRWVPGALSRAWSGQGMKYAVPNLGMRGCVRRLPHIPSCRTEIHVLAVWCITAIVKARKRLDFDRWSSNLLRLQFYMTRMFCTVAVVQLNTRSNEGDSSLLFHAKLKPVLLMCESRIADVGVGCALCI